MSDITTTTTTQNPAIFRDNKKEKVNQKIGDVIISNRYTHDGDGNIKKIEVIGYVDENDKTGVALGISQGGYFYPYRDNEDVKNFYIDKEKKISILDLNREERDYIEKSIKKINTTPKVLQDLRLINNKEKRSKFFKEYSKKNQIDILNVEEDIDSFNAENRESNLEKLRSKKFREKYGNYCYPIGMKNTNQDRIKITVVDFQGQELPPKGSNNPTELERKIPEKKINRGSVILPIPDGVSDSNGVNFSQKELNPLQVAGAQAALDTLLEGLGPGASRIGDIATEAFKRPETTNLVANALTSFALGLNPDDLLARTEGARFNNNLALLFKGPTLRSFTFNFIISPRDQPESIEVQKIIRMFKQSSAVQRSESGLFLGAPHVYNVEFLSKGGTHTFLPRLKTCALEQFSVNYMPSNSYMTYENSSMLAYSLGFRFKEIDPIFNDDYDELDFTDFEEPVISDDGGSVTFFERNPDSGGIGF